MKSITEIVDKQLQAYNEKDFETFASCYHKNILSFDIETQSPIESLSGENFFTHYQNKFCDNPKIFCEVTNRMVHNDLVIDQEYIRAYKGKNHREIVIYKVEDGRISKMWFSKEIEESNI
jgi:hypothetical protein